MDIQTIIAAVIIVAALAYAGSIVFSKVKSFSPKNSCGAGCGCESKSKTP